MQPIIVLGQKLAAENRPRTLLGGTTFAMTVPSRGLGMRPTSLPCKDHYTHFESTVIASVRNFNVQITIKRFAFTS